MKDVIKETLAFKDLTPEEKEKRGILGRLYGPIADIVNPTRNGRAYSEELWEKVFNENEIVKELLAKGGIPGELDHPADRQEIASERIAIMMPEAPKRDKSGKLIAYFDILDTPLGKIAYQLAKYGFELGISSRAQGEVLPNNEVDPDTYEFTCFDLVLIPSIKEARLKMTEGLVPSRTTFKQALAESLETVNDNDRKVMEETLKELNIDLNEEKTITYKVVDADGNKVKSGGGFLDKEEAELFAAQYGKEGLKVLKEEWEEDEVKTEDEIDPELDKDIEIINDEVGEDVEVIGAINILKSYLDFEGNEDHSVSIKLQSEEDWDKATVITIPSLSDNEYKILEDELHDKTINPEEETESTPEEDEDKLSSDVVTDEQTIKDEEEAIDEGSEALLKSLQDALVEKSTLEADIKSLQEKLAVSDIKVNELNEEVAKYKSATARLSTLAHSVKGLKTEITSLEESIKVKDQVINTQKAKIQRLNEGKAEHSSSVEALTESISAKDKQITSLKESVSNQKEELEAKITQLNEELKQSTTSSTKQINELKESLNKTIKARNGYKQLANNAVNSYINHRAVMLGVSPETIKDRLDEAYTVEDIDRICEDLQEYTLNVSRLPFNVGKNIKVKVTESKNDILNPTNPDDDIENGFLDHMII